MPNPSLSVRIGSTGKAELRNDFADIRKDGVQTQEDIAAASEAAAKRATNAYQRAADDMLSADRRRAAAADKVAAMAPQTSVQFASTLGAQPAGGLAGKSAQESAAAIRELLKAEDDLAARTHALQMAYDPLYAAQTRYNQAVRNSTELLAAGRITQQTHQLVLTQEEAALRKVKEGVEGHSAALGFNRLQAITAQSAVMRFVDSIIAGQSPLRAFALEAHKVGEVVALDDNGVAGGLAKVRALINPLTVGLFGLGAVLVAGAAAWLSYSNAEDKLNAVAQVSGRVLGVTGEQLEANAEAAARAGDMSVAAARAIETGYVRAGGIGAEVLTGLTGMTRDFAAATGQDAKAATAELAKAFQDPAKGAQELADKYGLVSQEAIDYIQHLVEQNHLTEAQLGLLKQLEPAFDGAADHANVLARGWHGIADAASDAWSWMGKAIDRALTGGSTMDRIANLEAIRARALAGDGTTFVPGGAEDQELQQLRAQLRQEQARARNAQQNRDRQLGQDVVNRYTGAGQLSDYRSAEQRLQAALATDMPPDQRRQMTEALQAYQHAIETFIPTQEKAVKLAQLDEQIARAKTKSQKDQLTAERERLKVSGQVITAADAEAMAHAKGATAADNFRKHTDRHAETLRREAESMEVDTRETLKLADAYLRIGQSTLVAEARRKAMTDATKKGIDVEAQVRRQVALAIAQEAASSGKKVGQLRDENSVRAAVNDRVAAGTLSVQDMNTALSDELAIRPLLKLRLVAHGEALEVLTRIIDAYTDGLKEAHAEEARSGALAAADAATQQASDILALMPFNADPRRQQIEAARLAAAHEADDKHFVGPERDAFLRSRSTLAGAQQADASDKYFTATLREQRDSLAMTQAELKLVGANDNYRQAELDKLKAILDLKRQGIDPDSADGKAILASVAALDQEQAKLRAMQADWQELKGFGDQFIDDVLNTDNWKNWGDFAKMVLNDLMKELEKLALINPLKNWLLGENNPTGGGFLKGLLGSLFGGGSGFGGGGFDASGLLDPSSLSSGALLDDVPLGAFASGTEYSSAGAALVGEQGPEIVNLPGGSKVIPAGETRRLLASNDAHTGPLIFNDFRGAVVTEDLMRQAEARAQQLIDKASPDIAARGARMAFDTRQRLHGRI